MAILLNQTSGGIRSYPIEGDLCPEGTYPALCVDLMETLEVEEPSYNDPEIMVVKDKIRVLFGVKVEDEIFLCQTYEFNISGSPKSKLFGFIKSWMGKNPAPGFDTVDLIGHPCQITISHATSKRGTGRVYASVDSIAPLMDAALAPSLGSIDVPGGRQTESPALEGSVSDSESSSDEVAGKDPF